MLEQLKHLTKSNDRKLAGVCGGIAEVLQIDPTIVRAVTVLLATGIFLPAKYILITYMVLALVLPEG